MLSASTYKNMIDVSGDGQHERISLSYVRTMLRNTDSADSVFVSDFHGYSALRLEEVFNDLTFVTLIYHHDGWVHELFHEEGQVFYPGQGVPIIRAESLDFEELDGGLIRVSTNFGSLLLFPRSTSTEGGF